MAMITNGITTAVTGKVRYQKEPHHGLVKTSGAQRQNITKLPGE